MVDFQHLVRVDVDDLGSSKNRFRRAQVPPVKMHMPVKVVTRFGNFDEPVDGFEPGMCLGVIIMYTERRRMCDEDIERAPILGLVEKQLRQHFVCAGKGGPLGVLIGSVGAVEDASAQAADQEVFEADQFLVQVRTAFSVRFWVIFAVGRVMVSRHIKQGYVQERDDIFQIGIGEIAASNNHFNIFEMTIVAKTI